MHVLSALTPVATALPTLKKALVLLSSTPNIDTVASGLALAIALRKAGVQVQVGCQADMRVEFSRLVGVDEVTKKLGNRNLVVSFAYNEAQVEKVAYNFNDDKTRFQLIITPPMGAGSAVDLSTLSFDYTGVETDATFLVGITSYQELGAFYEEERNAIEGSLTVALTLFPASTYAKIHVDAQGYTAMSEMMVAAISSMGLTLETDSASNLLYGIEAVTSGFSSPLMTAETFESIAILLRAGGQRQPVGQQGTLTPQQYPYTPEQTVVAPVTPAPSVPDSGVNPFASAMSKTAHQGGTTPAGFSATGELKG